jgi:hypothetical protein
VYYNLHPGQARAWESAARIVAVIAGNQSGKSEFASLWLLREIKNRGPGDYGFVSPTFTLMEMKALPAFRRVFEHIYRLGTFSGSPVRKFTFNEVGERQLWGAKQKEATVVYFGYADNPESLESATFSGCVCDEAGQKAFKQGSYEALRRRLAVKRGRMLIATTPYTAFGWLKSEVVDQDGKGEVPEFPHASAAWDGCVCTEGRRRAGRSCAPYSRDRASRPDATAAAAGPQAVLRPRPGGSPLRTQGKRRPGRSAAGPR